MEIGGYLGLELDRRNNNPIVNGVYVNSGRNALEYILKCLGHIQKLYLPKFTCSAVFDVITRLGIQFQTYTIDESLEIPIMPTLGSGEYIIVNNYFGIKDVYISQLCEVLKDKIIVDNSQAYFSQPINGVNTFYSPRKFVGVPDGGIAFANGKIDISETSQSWNIFAHLLKRIDLGASAGYGDFKENSSHLGKEHLMKMSNLTEILLHSINFDRIKSIRKKNYDFLDSALHCLNLLRIPNSDTIACPLVYPFRTKDRKLRDNLIKNEIFVATYWPNVLDSCNNGTIEQLLANEIIPLPIDQRYGIDDMKNILKVILNG